MMKYLVLLFLAVLIVIPLTNAGDRRKLCGRRLSESLSLACEGDYFTPGGNNIKRRSLEQYIRGGPNYVPDWIRQRGSYRLTRGIVDECCNRGCSNEELSAYCG